MKRFLYMLITVFAVLLMTACSMTTADKLYQLPKRTDDYNDLQSVIDKAISGFEYYAPLTGENQQTVQTVDLDGDGNDEFLVFAKGGDQRPLRIFIFDEIDGSYKNVDVLESNGSAFDLVEYVQMDNLGGMEIVVGRQISDQLVRTVSVYTFSGGEAELLLNANYTKFVTVDLDMDSKTELFVLRPGETDTDNGTAELYGVENGIMQRSNEVDISGAVDHLKRIIVGRLEDGTTAVYTANAVSDTALITDVYAYVDGYLSNVSFSSESGTSVNTLRNYYIYADDVDNDGTVELPALTNMRTLDEAGVQDRHYLIRWYAMKIDGSEVNKMYTYHDFVGGWYLELGSEWAPRVTIDQIGNTHAFYIWSDSYDKAEKIFTIYALTGQNRETEAQQDGRFILLKTDTVTYSANLESNADLYQINQESLIRSFRLIQQDWKTGET